MAKISQDNNNQDDQVFAKLYKEGAKETPPAKLNSEILNYAANANKSAANNSHIGSHFGGGWKVPLSMAASVVVVFALLVQLDQSPQQLELPPIPDISIPTEDSATKKQPASKEYNEELNRAEEALANDASSFLNDSKKSDMDSQNTGALVIDNPVSTEAQEPTNSIQTKPITTNQNAIKKSADKKDEKKIETLRERVQSQQESTTISPEPVSNPPSSITKSKSEKGYATPKPKKPAKPQAAQKQIQAPNTSYDASSNNSSGAVMQERSMNERRDNNVTSSDMAADTEVVDEVAEEKFQTEAEFAPVPVEDWLLMIEKLVAQKDYAEAARQLDKFKQAHPKVNVEELDAKIP